MGDPSKASVLQILHPLSRRPLIREPRQGKNWRDLIRLDIIPQAASAIAMWLSARDTRTGRVHSTGYVQGAATTAVQPHGGAPTAGSHGGIAGYH